MIINLYHIDRKTKKSGLIKVMRKINLKKINLKK